MGLSGCDVWLLSALSGSPAAGHELQPCPQSHRGAGTCWFLCSGFCPPKKEPLGSPQWHLCHPECPGRAQRQPLITRECEPHALFMPHPSRNQQGWRVLRKFSIKKGKAKRNSWSVNISLGWNLLSSKASQCLQCAQGDVGHFQNSGEMPEGESLQGLLVALRGTSSIPLL